MLEVCQYFQALHRKGEDPSALQRDPEALMTQGPTSKEFYSKIRQCNSACAFTCLGVPKRRVVTHAGGGMGKLGGVSFVLERGFSKQAAMN